jgi:hypothetical protein
MTPTSAIEPRHQPERAALRTKTPLSSPRRSHHKQIRPATQAPDDQQHHPCGSRWQSEHHRSAQYAQFSSITAEMDAVSQQIPASSRHDDMQRGHDGQAAAEEKKVGQQMSRVSRGGKGSKQHYQRSASQVVRYQVRGHMIEFRKFPQRPSSTIISIDGYHIPFSSGTQLRVFLLALRAALLPQRLISHIALLRGIGLLPSGGPLHEPTPREVLQADVALEKPFWGLRLKLLPHGMDIGKIYGFGRELVGFMMLFAEDVSLVETSNERLAAPNGGDTLAAVVFDEALTQCLELRSLADLQTLFGTPVQE